MTPTINPMPSSIKTAAPWGWFGGIVTALVSLRAAMWAVGAWAAIGLPLESFHLEAKMVHHARRVQLGKELYPAWDRSPSLPNFFGPVHPMLVGGLARVVNADLPAVFTIGRVVSVAATVLAALGIGWFVGRIEGRGKRLGLVAGLATLGGVPLVGFSTMTRCDLLADTLGILGFGLAGWAVGRPWLSAPSVGSDNHPNEQRSASPGLVAASVVLAAAILTKQTSGIYLIAAVVGLVWAGRRREAIALSLGTLGLTALVVAALSLTVTPRLAASLLGESSAPWSLSHWARVVGRLVRNGPELLILPALGFGLWARSGQPLKASLAIVTLAVSLAASAKIGSDQNYFLGLRLVAALALVEVMILAPTYRGRTVLRVLALGSLLPSLALQFGATSQSWQTRSFFDSVAGRVALEPYAALFRQASDRSAPPFLTDSGLLSLYQDEVGRAWFVDPWLYRLMVVTGRTDPGALVEAVEARRFERLVLTSDLFSDLYDTYEFGLPPQVVAAARRHYRLVGRVADLFLYELNPLPSSSS